jgi:two-component system, chemotaxis family, protein-glutamate methylesterase/glutaminase
MRQRDILVLGASAGGVDALKELVAQLPSTLPAAIFVVVHISPESPGLLPQILDRVSPLSAQQAEDGAAIVPGHIYVAPPDRHLLLERGHMRITRGPKENRFRPAIDPLFRSAAYAYGAQVIGVILTGMLDDGTAGLWAVKDRGGIAVVQEPADALYPSMPCSALQHIDVDHRLRLAEMAPLLVRLASEPIAEEGETPVSDTLQIETQIAGERSALEAGVLRLGPPSTYTCPECNGVLLQVQEGSILRFRCHTGHAYSMESLLAAIATSIEQAMGNAMRIVEEHLLLLRHMAQHVRGQQEEALAQQYEQTAQAAEQQVQALRALSRAQGRRPQDQ